MGEIGPKLNLRNTINPTKIEGAMGRSISLEEIWAKERREGDPEVKFEIVFGPHLFSSDIKVIEREFEDADIYIPESFPADQETQDIYQALSAGLTTPKQTEDRILSIDPDSKKRPGYFFGKATREMIYRRGKIVILIDLPRGHPLTKQQMALREGLLSKEREAKSLEEAVKLIEELLVASAQLNIDRENFMLGQIPQKIREILDKRPELKNKPQIKVLISLGSLHTTLYPKLRSLAGDKLTHRSFPSGLNLLGFRAEIMKRIEMGQDINSISEEFWLKAIFEMDFMENFKKSISRIVATIGTQKLDEKLRNIINKFSVDDIIYVYEHATQSKEFRDVVLEVFKKKGIKMAGL